MTKINVTKKHVAFAALLYALYGFGMMLFAAQAKAIPIDLDYQGYQGGLYALPTGQTAGVGLLHFTSDILGDIAGFCIEITDPLRQGPYDISTLALNPDTSPMGVTRADDMADLFATVLPDFNAVRPDAYMSAIQFAVWEVAGESTGSYSFWGGDHTQYVNSATLLATNWLDMLNSGTIAGVGHTTDYFTAVDVGFRGGQDLVFQRSSVPEPNTTVLFALGMVLLVIANWKKAKV